MRRTRREPGFALAVGAAVILVVAVLGWLLFAGFPARERAETTEGATGAASGETAGGRTIRASLFYVAENGRELVAVEREVPYGDNAAEQARLLMEEQLKEAPAPFAQALPPGTALRTVFVSDRGEAFVDLSSEVSTRHTGGSLEELLTVYTIVNTLTVNLPAIVGVQILVDGKEVDTLAGHIDLRNPLRKNLKWVQEGTAQSPSSGEGGDGADRS